MYIQVEPPLITKSEAAKEAVASGKAFSIKVQGSTQVALFQGTEPEEAEVLHGFVARGDAWVPLSKASAGNPKDLIVLNGKVTSREDVECLDCPAYLDYSIHGACSGACPSMQGPEQRARFGMPEIPVIRQGTYRHVKPSWFVLKPFEAAKGCSDPDEMLEAYEARRQVALEAGETRRLRKENCTGCVFLGNGCQGLRKWRLDSFKKEPCNATEADVVQLALANVRAKYGSLAAFRRLLEYCGDRRVIRVPGKRPRKAMAGFPAGPGRVHVVSTVWPHQHLGVHTIEDLGLPSPMRVTATPEALAIAYLFTEALHRGARAGRKMDYSRVHGHSNRVLGLSLSTDRVSLYSASSGGIWTTTWSRREIADFGDTTNMLSPWSLGAEARRMRGQGSFGGLLPDFRNTYGRDHCETCHTSVVAVQGDKRFDHSRPSYPRPRCGQHVGHAATTRARRPSSYGLKKLEAYSNER